MAIMEEKPIRKFNNLLLVILILFSTVIQMPLLFWPAGTLFWFEGWAYLIIFFITFSIMMVRLNNKNPEIIINRMKMKKQVIRKKKDQAFDEKDKVSKASGTDKIIFPLFIVCFIALFIVPAFERRYNWSISYIWIEIIGFILLPISLYIIYRVMLENAFASKVLDIRKESGQKLIDTGPYAIVRHPMYSGFVLMFFAIVLALGSWFALIPAFLTLVIMVIRIKFEETMLIEGLEGYREYKERIKYKLIPWIY